MNCIKSNLIKVKTPTYRTTCIYNHLVSTGGKLSKQEQIFHAIKPKHWVDNESVTKIINGIGKHIDNCEVVDGDIIYNHKVDNKYLRDDVGTSIKIHVVNFTEDVSGTLSVYRTEDTDKGHCIMLNYEPENLELMITIIRAMHQWLAYPVADYDDVRKFVLELRDSSDVNVSGVEDLTDWIQELHDNQQPDGADYIIDMDPAISDTGSITLYNTIYDKTWFDEDE